MKVESIGKSDENRELVVVWISSDDNISGLQKNRDNLARLADPRRSSEAEIRQLIATTKPHYHLMGGLHSGETGPSEMLMELAYRLATETSPLIKQIRDNVYVSITPVADPDGRDRNVDWFYRNREMNASRPEAAAGRGAGPESAQAGETQAGAGGGGGAGGRGGDPGVPYWGKYVFHDNNRDINLSQVSMRAITDWYFTAHPPIMHDLHESQPLLYTYSGAAPQNPNLDPILFAELPFFSNFELAQMTKWGMPGVYTHAFMDGWSPGYLGSVAYNHNGMMRMYETQGGNDITPPACARAHPCAVHRAGGRARSRRGESAETDAERPPPRPDAGRTHAARRPRPHRRPARSGPGRRRGTRRTRARRSHRPRRRSGGGGHGGSGRPRRGDWSADGSRRRAAARMVPRPADSAGDAQQLVAAEQRQLHADRRAVGPAAHGDDPQPGARELLSEDQELDRIGKDRGALRIRHPGPARHDAGRGVDQHPSCARHRDRPRHRRDQASAMASSPPART